MIPFRKTIGFRLTLMGFLGLTLPLLIDAAVVFTRRYETRVEASKRYLTEAAVLRVIPAASYEPFPNIAFDILVRYLGIEKAFPKGLDETISKQLVDLAKLNELHDIIICTIDEKGQYIVTASAHEYIMGENLTKFFLDPGPMDAAASIDDPVIIFLSYRKNFVLNMILAKPYKSLDGKRMGMVAVVSDLSEWVKKVLAEDTTYYPVRFAITNPNSIVMAATDPTLLFHYFRKLTRKDFEYFDMQQLEQITEVLPKEPLTVLEPMRSGSFMRFLWQGKEQFGVVEPMPWGKSNLLSYASKREIYAVPLKDFIGIFVSYTVILLIGGVIVYFVTKRWMRPVQSLGAVMVRVKEGDLSARYEKRSLVASTQHTGSRLQ